jgi:hypothetical protein
MVVLKVAVLMQAGQASQERLYLESLIRALNLSEARVLPMLWVCRVCPNIRVLNHLVKEEYIKT